eukprot:jgi/Galph1/4751/GphlegSOOS_G3354.1
MSNPLLRELIDTKLLVTLRRSFIGKHRIHKEILQKLGVTKIHQVKVLPDSERVWKDLKRVVHLVELERVSANEAHDIAAKRPRLPRPSYQKPKFVPHFQLYDKNCSQQVASTQNAS